MRRCWEGREGLVRGKGGEWGSAGERRRVGRVGSEGRNVQRGVKRVT
jgi:hypothetical protein